MEKSLKRNIKKRNWAFIVYPESVIENWIEILQKSGLQCAISPLHDKDLNADEAEKKEHYHVIICYSGPTSYNVVSSLTASLFATIPQALEQVRGYYRYFTHKDNPEKTQYDEKEIRTINGFNILDFVEMTKSEVMTIKRQVQQLIREMNITEYSYLVDYLLDENMMEQHEVASNHTYFFDKYISSRRHIALNIVRSHVVDPLTGELLIK